MEKVATLVGLATASLLLAGDNLVSARENSSNDVYATPYHIRDHNRHFEQDEST